MTCVAYDGRTLAADKRTNFGGGLHATTTKVHRLKDGSLVGCAGATAQIAEILHWLDAGAKPEDIPATQKDEDKCVSVLLIRPDGQIWQYENTAHPIKIENAQWAIGSGRDFAMAAMLLGHGAVRAVEVACTLCSSCGNGVDSLELDSIMQEEVAQVLKAAAKAIDEETAREVRASEARIQALTKGYKMPGKPPAGLIDAAAACGGAAAVCALYEAYDCKEQADPSVSFDAYRHVNAGA